MAEQKQNRVAILALIDVVARWLVTSPTWIRRTLMSKDHVLEKASEFERKLKAGETRVLSAEESRQQREKVREINRATEKLLTGLHKK
jgi:hypothetical protein